jgi:hypothetical protein
VGDGMMSWYGAVERHALQSATGGFDVIEIVIFIVFIMGLVVGSLVANALGRLPSAEELEEQDRLRLRKLERSA